jgi:hypothetical protein
MINNNDFIPYTSILDDIKKYKQAGTRFGDDFNLYDTPSHKYFKILFYFGSDSEFTNIDETCGSGLLAPTWEVVPDSIQENDINFPYYNYNSAWAYLKLNDENERAEKLEQFVTLLSNISSLSPWYFTSVSGI